MTPPIKSPKKLIEVALPLDAINQASAREKSIRHGHPSTLHLWWARRPLAAARAVIFAQLVNDPGFQNGKGFRFGKNKKEAAVERKRLFDIIERLVQWENTNNEEVLEEARAEIRKSWREVCELNKDHPQAAELFNPDKLPGLHDPFAGGGAIPLEAQRLGLEAYASDLNPVAVLINKAMIEIPPKFANIPPVNPEARKRKGMTTWKGAEGLAEDVRYYGEWMRKEAENRIGHLYPKVEVTEAMAKTRPDLKPYVGKKLTVIAWLWARTVKSPNPAFSHVDVPLTSTFILSSKAGKEAYVEPVIAGSTYRFTVKRGTPPSEAKNGTKLARGANFRCILSGSPIEPSHVYAEAQAGRMRERLLAIVAEGKRERVYLPPTDEHEAIAKQAQPEWKPQVAIPANPRWFSPPLYGLKTFGDLFTSRQLVALASFSELAQEARDICANDAAAAGHENAAARLDDGGIGARSYGEAIGLYLTFALDKVADRNTSLCSWETAMDRMRNTFGRQAIPMVWDYVETNPFAGAGGDVFGCVESLAKTVENLDNRGPSGRATTADAKTQSGSRNLFVSTDPPYYDNIGYADLSDFFYVWLRRSLRDVFPSLFSTIAVPKTDELVAIPFRHGSRATAESFFLEGMTEAMRQVAEQAHPGGPVTIYYAFKQSETTGDAGTSSTGWETFLDALIRAGFAITGTWPMRTELSHRMVSAGTNALASSIVLVCRKRDPHAETISRREFIRELNQVLPEALDEMTRGAGEDRPPVAPVDLSQAIIGPGMAIFSKYAAVLEADGTPMSVRTALQLINRFLAEDDFDRDTQFCLQWFEQYGWNSGAYGQADVLARSKATSVGGLQEAGVVQSRGGKVRLFRPSEYPDAWDPRSDGRTPVWEALHHLIRALRKGGESEAGRLLAPICAKADAIRQLAYRLYTLCERRGWAEDARGYNELVTSWSAIEAVAHDAPKSVRQGRLFRDT